MDVELDRGPRAIDAGTMPSVGCAPLRFVRRCGLVWLLLGVITVFALLVRTQHIGDLSFWFDESCSWKISRFAWREMLDAVSHDAHPPLYHLVLKAWAAVFGEMPAAARALSVLLGLATVVAAFWFVRTALGECDAEPNWRPVDRDFAALLAGMLVAASALHVDLSHQARPYTLGTFLAVTSAGFLLKALRAGSAAVNWVVFATLGTLLSFTHYYGLFTVAAEFLFAIGVLVATLWRTGWSGQTWRLVSGVGLSAWGIQVVWAWWFPVFQFQHERAKVQLWMGPLDWQQLAGICWRLVAGGQGSAPAADAYGALAPVYKLFCRNGGKQRRNVDLRVTALYDLGQASYR